MLAALLLLLTTLTAAAAATNSRLTQLLSLVSLSLSLSPSTSSSSLPSPHPLSSLFLPLPSSLISSSFFTIPLLWNKSFSPPSLFPLVAPDHSFRSTITPPCLNHLAHLSFSLCQISLCLVCPFWKLPRSRESYQ
ncbi:uncharacterized protein BO87DRAFT_8375 [Aspergillus neoniger CBS 115656]|uniref:REJ domain-containing protein n=1 Tax=Aspergillus neoniger (strain CBS 115656) TaxID=1448310 RepID=A0A318YYW5_ASPNB|nr:hypothetical protein BO87DRAFT_8375 [Aspergillus neoniger CBS 115656]PYH39866.1 hypothetical protein BO87DRAFT_8375 [Aspergillus neoniger CBS 115656]